MKNIFQGFTLSASSCSTLMCRPGRECRWIMMIDSDDDLDDKNYDEFDDADDQGDDE